MSKWYPIVILIFILLVSAFCVQTSFRIAALEKESFANYKRVITLFEITDKILNHLLYKQKQQKPKLRGPTKKGYKQKPPPKKQTYEDIIAKQKRSTKESTTNDQG
jgi:hypothetical protein